MNPEFVKVLDFQDGDVRIFHYEIKFKRRNKNERNREYRKGI